MSGRIGNLTILERNTVDGLSDEAAELYLRASQRDELKAARMAWEWDDRLAPRLMPADRYAWIGLTLEFTGAVAFIAIVCATVWSAT